MSLYSYGVAWNRRKDSEREDRDEWRKESLELDRTRRLRRERHQIDCGSLDRSARHVQRLLDNDANLHSQLHGLQELIGDFRRVIEKAEEKKVDTYVLRKKLISLEYRAMNVYKEMQRRERAPEFNEKALRGILKDYKSLRV